MVSMNVQIPKRGERSPTTTGRRRPVYTFARLLGRQIAREQFAGLYAANDNRPTEEIREPWSRQA